MEASRLCAAAEGGQILATHLVRVMAGRRSPHPFTPLGDLEVAGIADPVEVVQVEWEPLSEAAGAPAGAELIPMPRRLSHRPTIGFIGRELHLSTLEDAYKRVAHREGREVVLIGGEAGQGKTTLASEFARDAPMPRGPSPCSGGATRSCVCPTPRLPRPCSTTYRMLRTRSYRRTSRNTAPSCRDWSRRSALG